MQLLTTELAGDPPVDSGQQANAAPSIGRVNALQLTMLPARLFLAMGWARAGVEKVLDRDWWSGIYLRDFLVEQQDAALPFANWFGDTIGARTAIGVSFIVLLVELALGFYLLTGRRLTAALGVASALNVAFVAFGAVNPSAFYLVIQLTLMLSLVAGKPVISTTRNLLAIGASLLTAVAMAPFIMTLHPHGVIDDPAIMLATLAMLVATTVAIRLFDHHQAEKRAFVLATSS